MAIPEPKAVWSSGVQWKFFPFVITAVFFILSLIGIIRHEMWRDEYQAWMVAADADSITGLFRNLKYEGHPFLWHSFLFIITAFTADPFWMQLFHILISTSFIFLINRCAPFTLLQKALLTFGYYTFFEYNLISRGYGLGFLMVVIFCILYQQRKKHILWIGIVLFLMSNISIFGVILATCFFGIIAVEQLSLSNKQKSLKIPLSAMILFGVIALTGIVAGFLQIKPEHDNSFPTLYVTHYDGVRAKWAFSRLIHAYLPIPDFRTLHFWNTNFFVPVETRFMIGITPALFMIWLISFLRYRLLLMLYAGGTMLLLIFYYYTGFIWARYAGHLLLLLIACCWLLHEHKEKPFKSKLIDKISVVGNQIRDPLFIVILAIGMIGGVTAYIMDMKHPFSTSGIAADYIQQNHLDSFEIIGSKDYVISPLATQLRKKIYYAERKEPGSFIIYDQKRINIWSFSEVQATITEKWSREHKRIILVKDLPIYMTFNDTGESVLWEDAQFTDSLNLRLLTSIPPGIVKDERYYIYSVDGIYK